MILGTSRRSRYFSRGRRSRGQVLPVMAVMLGLLCLIAMFFINTFGFLALVERATDSAGHQAGLAATQQVNPADSSRWDIDPIAATTTARAYAIANLQGANGGAGYASFIDLSTEPGDLSTLMDKATGTVGDVAEGMDVEVIVPAQAAGQTSLSYLDCDTTTGTGPCPTEPQSNLLCDTTTEGTYPAEVGSAITGVCYNQSTVIVRIRLRAIQLGVGSAQMDRVIVTQAGDND